MSLARTVFSASLALLWPARCAGCDAALPHDDVVFCDTCRAGLNPMVGACLGCALPLLGSTPPDQTAARCRRCARKAFAFSRAYAGFEYGESIATAIMRMKHGGRPDLARRLARVLTDTVARAMDPNAGPPVDIVVPVPLHPAKLRRRGFNQALELSHAVLRRLRAAASSGTACPGLERRLLLRVKETRELGRSGPGERRAEVSGAFAVAAPARVTGRRFLVLDDVMTTGATLNECAHTLMRAGAAEVRVAALARAVA